MKLIQGQNSEAVEFIREHLVDDPDYGGVMVDYLKVMITDFPDNIRIFIAVEGRDLVGFSIAVSEEAKPHVYMVQMWVDPQTKGLSSKLFLKNVLWTESLGKKSIRTETRESTRALERRWGFKLLSSIVEYTIPEEIADLLTGKEPDDGQPIRVEERDGIHGPGEPEAAPGVQRPSSSDDGGDQERADSLPGSDDGSADAGDVAGPPDDERVRPAGDEKPAVYSARESLKRRSGG